MKAMNVCNYNTIFPLQISEGLYLHLGFISNGSKILTLQFYFTLDAENNSHRYHLAGSV